MRIVEKVKKNIPLIITTLVMLGCVFPIYMYGCYTVPLADDFGMIIPAYQAWVKTQNIFAVLKAAFDWAVLCYKTWAGDYVCMFLQCLPIGLGNFRLYFVSGWIIISIFIFAIYYTAKVFLIDFLHADKKKTYILASITLVFILQFLPDLYDAFYWYTTSVAYTLSFSLKLALIAGVFKTLWVKNKAHKLNTVLLTISCFLSAAFECSFTQTGFFLIISIFSVYCFLVGKKKVEAGGYWVATTIGWGITLLAPGNMVRQNQSYGGTTGVVAVIWEALHRGVESISEHIDLPLILVTCLLLPLIYHVVKDSHLKYKWPGLFTLLSVGVYASGYAPWIFSRGVEYPNPYGGDSGYVTNVFWYTFVLLWFANVIYWIGWIVENLGIGIPKLDKKKAKRLKYSFYSVVLFGMLFWTLRLEHVMEYTSPRLLWHIVNGNAKAYYTVMEERENLLLNKTEYILIVPKADMPIETGGAGDITSDEKNWVNEGVAAYYGLKYGVRTEE